MQTRACADTPTHAVLCAHRHTYPRANVSEDVRLTHVRTPAHTCRGRCSSRSERGAAGRRGLWLLGLHWRFPTGAGAGGWSGYAPERDSLPCQRPGPTSWGRVRWEGQEHRSKDKDTCAPERPDVVAAIPLVWPRSKQKGAFGDKANAEFEKITLQPYPHGSEGCKGNGVRGGPSRAPAQEGCMPSPH